MENQKDYFQDLIVDEVEDDEEVVDDENKQEEKPDVVNEEEQRQKNKDAEEARKRREAEAKAKAEEEAKKQEETKKTNVLGEQLVTFKKKYPNIDLKELDNDKQFKNYIDGKLLGKKDFTILYEDFVELKSELSKTTSNEATRNHEAKAKASSGSPKSSASNQGPDVYTEEEIQKLSKKIPLMSDKEVKKVLEKFDRSIEFHKKNKK